MADRDEESNRCSLPRCSAASSRCSPLGVDVARGIVEHDGGWDGDGVVGGGGRVVDNGGNSEDCKERTA